MLSPQQKWNKKNKDKLDIAAKKYRKNHPEKIAQQNKERSTLKRDWKLKTNYGISLKDWEALFVRQDKCCAICGEVDTPVRGWNTDHCHTTGLVRGILCPPCNILLGMAKDNVNILNNAIKYLKRS